MIENSITQHQFTIMKIVFWFSVSIFLIVFLTPIFLFSYPFKTIKYTVPVEVLNPGKKVECNGVVVMNIYYEKYIDEPGLTIRTLVARDNEETIALDSSTVVSDRKPGKGQSRTTFVLIPNPAAIGKDRRIVFTIYHTLFGVRQIMKQFESEPFEIVNCNTKETIK